MHVSSLIRQENEEVKLSFMEAAMLVVNKTYLTQFSDNLVWDFLKNLNIVN